MRVFTSAARALVLCGIAGMGGCQSGARTSSAPAMSPAVDGARQVVAALVAPAAAGWEFGRNDDRMALRPPPVYSEARWVEVYTHERLRTINGRPTESTTTTTRTLRQSSDP